MTKKLSTMEKIARLIERDSGSKIIRVDKNPLGHVVFILDDNRTCTSGLDDDLLKQLVTRELKRVRGVEV